MTQEKTLSLDEEDVQAIRRALIIGLDSYGEIERVLGYADAMKTAGQELPKDAIPLHPTGSDQTIGFFASALACLN